MTVPRVSVSVHISTQQSGTQKHEATTQMKFLKLSVDSKPSDNPQRSFGAAAESLLALAVGHKKYVVSLQNWVSGFSRQDAFQIYRQLLVSIGRIRIGAEDHSFTAHRCGFCVFGQGNSL